MNDTNEQRFSFFTETEERVLMAFSQHVTLDLCDDGLVLELHDPEAGNVRIVFDVRFDGLKTIFNHHLEELARMHFEKPIPYSEKII